MTQALNLGGTGEAGTSRIRRLNRLPIIVAIVLVVAFFGIIIYGLSSRGIRFGDDRSVETSGSPPASSYADRLTQGIPNGIIGEPEPTPFQPTPTQTPEHAANPFIPQIQPEAAEATTPLVLEPEDTWRAQLQREQQEQLLRELHRQRMASLQADDAAYDSPIAVSLRDLSIPSPGERAPSAGPGETSARPQSALDLYAAAMQTGAAGQSTDPNGQGAKESFFNHDLRELGYLPNPVVPQTSPYQLKRGSVIPATLVTGINSDLPGRITAQVSQNVYDDRAP